jgi:hypothetical protein
MDEQIMFDRIHQALDVETPRGAYEQLRSALVRRSVDRTLGVRQGPKWWPRAPMQLVAGLLVIVLAAVALAVFVAMHSSSQTAPAGALSIEAYQALVNRDVNRLDSIGAGDYTPCNSMQSICPELWKPVLMAHQQWLDDLNRSEPPAKFAVINGQLRGHLAAAISDINVALAAYQARDQNRLDYAEYASLRQDDWIDVLARSIVKARVATAAAYVDSVSYAKQRLDACQDCQQLAGTSRLDCAGLLASPCEGDVAFAKSAIQAFEAAVVSVAAPPSLAAQDAHLQYDLAEADTAVLAMANAEVAGDPAAFNAGRLLLQQTLPAIDEDVAGILWA